MTDASDLVERLNNPLWSHSKAPFESPQLNKEATLADMAEAATALTAKDKEIEALRKDRDFWKSERDRIRAFLSEGDCLMLESEQAWKARAEAAERELDTMNNNHRVMAKLLADTGRERDEARAALKEISDGYGPNHLSKFCRDVAARGVRNG